MLHNSSSFLASEEEFAPRIAYLLLVGMATIFGNLLVIVAVTRFKKLRRSTNLILASLAVADLMSGIVTIPLYILWTINPEVFDKSGFLCRFVLLSCLLLVAASQVSLLVLSFERYLAVCQPFRHRSLLLHCPWIHKVVILFIWTISGIATAISSLAIRPDYQTCSYYGVFDKMFLFLAVIFGVLVTFLVIIAINIRVLCSVREHEKHLSDVEVSNSGDVRNSSYLCYQDAFESHPKSGGTAAVKTGNDHKHLSKTKKELEEATSQTLLQGSDNETTNDEKKYLSDDGSNDFVLKRESSKRPRRSYSHTSSIAGDKGSFKMKKRSLKMKIPLLDKEEWSENTNCEREDSEKWDLYSKDVDAIWNGGETVKYYGQVGDENHASKYSKSVANQVKSLGYSLNDLNNPKIPSIHVGSVDCIIHKENPLRTAKQQNESTHCIFSMFSDASLSPKKLSLTKNILVEGCSRKVFTNSLQSSLNDRTAPAPLHVVNQAGIFTTNNEYRTSKENQTQSPSSKEKRNQSHCIEDNTGRTKRHRKVAKCHPENYCSVYGWTEENEQKCDKLLRDKQSKEHMNRYQRIKEDLFLNLPFVVSPHLYTPSQPGCSNCSCHRLQYLHLETKPCPMPLERFSALSVGINDHSTMPHLPHCVSLQNVSSEPFVKPMQCSENWENDFEEDDDRSDILQDSLNIHDEYPLLCTHRKLHRSKSSSKTLKYLLSKHLPKRQAKSHENITISNDPHRRFHDNSTKYPETVAGINSLSFHNSMHLDPGVSSHKPLPLNGESVPDMFSANIFNSLPLVPFPFYRSCPGFCSDYTLPNVTVSSPFTDTLLSSTHQTILGNEDTWELNIPCSLSSHHVSESCYHGNDLEMCLKTLADDCQRNQTVCATNTSGENTATVEGLGNNEDEKRTRTSNAQIPDDLKLSQNYQYDLRLNDNKGNSNLKNTDTSPNVGSSSNSNVFGYKKHSVSSEQSAFSDINNDTIANNINVYPSNRNPITKSKAYNNNTTTNNNVVGVANGRKISSSTTNRCINNVNRNSTTICSYVSNNSSSNTIKDAASRKSSSAHINHRRQAYISKKVARTVCLVCASFVVAWLPFFVVIIYNTFCTTVLHCNLDYALNAGLMVAFGQSACNPVIYALCHASFRRAYHSLLKHYLCCSNNTSNA